MDNVAKIHHLKHPFTACSSITFSQHFPGLMTPEGKFCFSCLNEFWLKPLLDEVLFFIQEITLGYISHLDPITGPITGTITGLTPYPLVY
jgi:hypothetical protein